MNDSSEATAPHPGSPGYKAPRTISRMLFATWALLNSLEPAQRASAVFPMDDPKRLDWDFIPKPDRCGVPMFQLNRHQRTVAHALLKSGLSMRGYTQALSVMATENVLREKEALERDFGVLAGDFRDPDAYYFSFFGRPGFEDTWGWRVIGHHLSLNYTIIGQRFLTATPCNMGAQPAPAGVLNPLGQDEDSAFRLLHSLPGPLRSQAHIHPVAPADFVTRQVARVGAVELPDYEDLGIPTYRINEEDRQALRFARAAPVGVRADQLPDRHWELLRDLLFSHTDRVPEELAEQYRGVIEHRGPADVHFAWAGGLEPGTPHYYRIHTSTILVESVNAIDSGNHIHSVWRDLGNDLGHDLLLAHPELAQSPIPQLRARLTPTEAE
jgi:Protein of unknown function (DUF3500)